ncbi:hypothetical protein [Methylotuvimicrobium sp. KM1]|jgi:hypothetical protein
MKMGKGWKREKAEREEIRKMVSKGMEKGQREEGKGALKERGLSGKGKTL